MPRRTHGHSRANGDQPSRTFGSWKAMRLRCGNPKNENYPRYGGKGVLVCRRWQDSFENFLADMGERPAGKTLDRWPDKLGNYEPGNCRWASPKEQGENRDNTGCGWLRNKTHCKRGHEFTPENTRIVASGSRRCRACEPINARERRCEAVA